MRNTFAIRLEESFPGSQHVLVFKGKNKEPHFSVVGADPKDLCRQKLVEYLYECDWTDKGAPGWITPELCCDSLMKSKPSKVSNK